jgi:energy-coupling factor transporter transmembrane protein EcfT
MMKYTIRKKGEKYYKKFKPCLGDLVAGLIVALAIIYIVFEVIRG